MGNGLMKPYRQRYCLRFVLNYAFVLIFGTMAFCGYSIIDRANETWIRRVTGGFILFPPALIFSVFIFWVPALLFSTLTSAVMEKIVIEFSTETNFARAYGVNEAQPFASGAVLELAAGNPADLILQLVSSGETVLALVLGGVYMSNHVARTHLPDGTIVPNNPYVFYQDATEEIIGLWQRLRQINKSFRIELLEAP